MRDSPLSSEIEKIDEVIQGWSQGDCVLEKQWFAHRFNPNLPLTEIAILNEEDDEADLAEEEIPGFVVITQTCDLVRSCSKRPYFNVSPLVKVDCQILSEIKKGKRPQYAYIPGVASLRFVADLDRVMTLEKAVLIEWKNHKGCQNDKEVRNLAQALARKQARVAFPDDFNQFVQELQKTIKKKHSKNTIQGKALRALSEIRVLATPSWSSPKIEIFFFFIREENSFDLKLEDWHKFLQDCLNLLPESERFYDVNGQVITLEDLSAKDYTQSDRLDLDNLSF